MMQPFAPRLPGGLQQTLNNATTIGTPQMQPFQYNTAQQPEWFAQASQQMATQAAGAVFGNPATVKPPSEWDMGFGTGQAVEQAYSSALRMAGQSVFGGVPQQPNLSIAQQPFFNQPEQAAQRQGWADDATAQGYDWRTDPRYAGTDFSAAPEGSLRDRLEQQRQGQSQYGTIAERTKENPLEVAGLLALGFGAPLGVARGASVPLLGTGLKFAGQAAAGMLGSHAVQQVPGFENLPTPIQSAARNAPYFIAGPGSALLKGGGVATTVLGGEISESLGAGRGTGEFVGGFAGAAPAALIRGGLGAVRSQIVSRKAGGILDTLAASTDEADLINRLKGMDPMDLMEVNEAVMRANPELAKELGRALAAARAGDMQAAQTLKGALYGEATTLSKRVAQMTGEAPKSVRERAIGRVAKGLGGQKAGISDDVPDDVSRLAFGDDARQGLQEVPTRPAQDFSSFSNDKLRDLYQTSVREADVWRDRLEDFLKAPQVEDAASGARKTLTNPDAIENEASKLRFYLHYYMTEAEQWRAELARRTAGPQSRGIVDNLLDRFGPKGPTAGIKMDDDAVSAIRRRKPGGSEIPVTQDPMAPRGTQAHAPVSAAPETPPALTLVADDIPPRRPPGAVTITGDEYDDLVRSTAKTPAGGSAPTYADRIANAPIEELGNAMRQSAAGLDFSFALRQGGLTIRHGREYLRSMGSAYKALGDDAYAQSRMQTLRSKERPGLYLSQIPGEVVDATKLTAREENYASDLIGNLPFYKQTGRANTLFLNEQRAAVFDQVSEAWQKSGWFNSKLARDGDLEALGNYISRMTGRGTLGPLEGDGRAASILNGVLGVGLFSPRYLASRPEALMNLFNVKHPRVAMEAWKDFGTYVAATGALLGLAKQAGIADVELDPTEADFGKFRVGKVSVDPWAGFQQLARFTARMQSGAWDGDYVAVGEELERFMRTKLAPLPGTVYSLALKDGKNIIGEDVTPGSLAVSLAPIFSQGIIKNAIEGDTGEIVKENLPAAALDVIGLGSQVYENVGLRRDQLSSQLYDSAYNELSPMRQAEVNAKLIENGVDIEASSRRGPWWSARDAALEAAGASNPIVAKFGSYEEWQDFWYGTFKDEGVPKSNWDTELTKVNRNAGITDLMQDLRTLAVLKDPGIVEALSEGDYAVPKYILDALEEAGVR